MNRQEFRVLTAFSYAVCAEVVPSDTDSGSWELWCEMQAPANDGPDRRALERSRGIPERFPDIETAAQTARAFGHPTCMVFFTRQEWSLIC